jgi:hypothetical protein
MHVAYTTLSVHHQQICVLIYVHTSKLGKSLLLLFWLLLYTTVTVMVTTTIYWNS